MALPADNIATTTLQAIRPMIADNIMKANPLVFFLLANGRVELLDGGKRIDEPLAYAVNSTVKAYSGYDKLVVAPTEEFTTAQYNWKQLAGSVSISGLEEIENSGENAVFNLLRQKLMVLEDSTKQFLAEKLTAISTSKTAKDFLGLDEIIEDGGATGTLGGINRATYTWWRNIRHDANTLTGLLASVRKVYNLCSKGISQPDLILSPYIPYEAFMDQNAGKQIVSDTTLLQMGWQNIRYMNATWIPDENVLANRIYFINTKYLRLKIHRRRNFVMTPFVRPHDQDARTSQLLVAGNLTCNNSRFQGVLEVD